MEVRMIRMDEFNKIRKAHFVDGLSINEVAIKFKRSWVTIKKIVGASRDEIPKESSSRKSTVATQEVLDAISDWLLEENKLNVKKKQTATAKKIFEELTNRGIYSGSVRRMQELVNDVRRKQTQIQPKGFLPLEFPLGSAAQVDHGEVECIIEGLRKVYYLFVMSVPGMALRYCQILPTKAQEAWGEFHERAFRFYNGRFLRLIYDNDTVLINFKNKTPAMTNFALHLVEHYQFESSFCNPASGNEKGAVENAVGFCRRNYLNGCPVFNSWQEANTHLENKCLNEIMGGTHYKNGKSLVVLKEELDKALMPILPVRKWRRWEQRRVNSYQLVEVDNHSYSVPEKFLYAQLRIGIGAFAIEIYCGEEFVVEHDRKFEPGADSLMLNHYLDQLYKKPGALWDCKAIQELVEDEILVDLWQKLVERYPKLPLKHPEKFKSAQINFIEVLMLRRRYPETVWKNATKKALECGAIEAAAIECIIRGITEPKKSIEAEQAVSEKLSHLHIPSWECDLSSYADLAVMEEQC